MASQGTPAMSNDKQIQEDALVAFKARNARCYRDQAILSLEATRMANPNVVRKVATASASPAKILPSAGVFGANGSGKSALLRAMQDMRSLVVNSFRRGSHDTSLHRRPFLLCADPDGATTEFEVELVLGGVFWQYGFEYNNERILREFAYHYPHGRQALVFERQGDSVDFGASFRTAGRALRPLLRKNALLLSTFGAVDDEQVSPLSAWWQRNLLLATAENRWLRSAMTADLATEEDAWPAILQLLRAASATAVDIKIVPPDADTLERLRQIAHRQVGDTADDEEFMVESELQLLHRGDNCTVAIPPEDESQGTKVCLGLAGPVLEVLAKGSVLLVDEIDTSLHPHIVARLIDLFQDAKTNPHCAQLVFNAHDTNILGNPESHALGRDQVWFTEKHESGDCRLYPLSDFRPRRDESIQRGYLNGRYGAIPRTVSTGR